MPTLHGIHAHAGHTWCPAFIYRTLDCVSETINAIWCRIRDACSGSPAPKLSMPLHPVPNPYPREYKWKDWPSYLDYAAWQKWGADHQLETDAQKADPLEQVTPLHANTLGDNTTGIFRLIAHGGDVRAKDLRGQTPAYWAAYFGNLTALMQLKVYGADLNVKDHRGKTLARAAAKYNHPEIISFLASHRINLNALDGRGLSPLLVAAYKGNFAVYERLIFSGADRTLKDRFGRTAEEVLKLKCAEIYRNKCCLFRWFSSPNPPALPLKPFTVDTLIRKING